MKKRDKDPVIEKEKQKGQDTTPPTRRNLDVLREMLKRRGAKRVPLKPGEVIVFVPENPKVRRPLIGEAPAKGKPPGTDSE